MITVLIENRNPVVTGGTPEYRVVFDDGKPSDWYPATHLQVGTDSVVFTAPDDVNTIPLPGHGVPAS